MNRMAIVGAILALVGTFSPCYGIWPFDTVAKKLGLELNAVKLSVADQADALVKANVSIGENAKSLADIKMQVGNIQAQLGLQATAIAGVNNKVTNSTAGRDMTTTTTQNNSDAVVTTMLNTYKAIIILLITQMVLLVKFTASMYQKIIDKMQAEQTRILISKDDKDSKLDAFQNSLIAKAFDNSTADQFKKDVADKRELKKMEVK